MKLYACGDNVEGQLGLGYTGNSPAVMSPLEVGGEWSTISVGWRSSYGIKTDGTLWSWGRNYSKQLGLGDTTTRSSPTQIGTDTDWIFISGGSAHAMAIKTDGSLWGWGACDNGRLGNGLSSGTVGTPTQIGTALWSSIYAGDSHTLGIKTDGTAWATGNNYSGMLGLGDSTQRTSFVQIGSDTWNMLGAGRYTSAGIKSNKTLWGWGNGDSVPPGTNVPSVISSDSFDFLSVGGQATILAIKSNKTLWGLGRNYNNQIFGTSDNTFVSSLTQIGSALWDSVSVRDGHSMGIGTNQLLYGWGSYAEGQLGFTTFDFLGPQNSWGSAVASVKSGQAFSLFLGTEFIISEFWTNFKGQREII